MAITAAGITFPRTETNASLCLKATEEMLKVPVSETAQRMMADKGETIGYGQGLLRCFMAVDAKLIMAPLALGPPKICNFPCE